MTEKCGFRVSEQPYCPREQVSKSFTNDKIVFING